MKKGDRVRVVLDRVATEFLGDEGTLASGYMESCRGYLVVLDSLPNQTVPFEPDELTVIEEAK